MIEKLANSFCHVKISSHGAELISLKCAKTGREYVWQGDEGSWNRRAPFLFPIVGRLKDNSYFYEGKEYSMGQHGFLRDMDLKVADKNLDTVVFELNSDENTKKIYPFDFRAQIRYELFKNSLKVKFSVENTGDSDMYFSYGNHAGYRLPLNEDLNFEDYYVELMPKEERKHFFLNEKKELDLARTEEVKVERIDLSHDIFCEDALIFETKGYTSISLRTDKENSGITISYSDFPYVGIWSSYPEMGDFVCIEPWQGIADTVDSDKDLKKKMGTHRLRKNARSNFEFSISIY